MLSCVPETADVCQSYPTTIDCLKATLYQHQQLAVCTINPRQIVLSGSAEAVQLNPPPVDASILRQSLGVWRDSPALERSANWKALSVDDVKVANIMRSNLNAALHQSFEHC